MLDVPCLKHRHHESNSYNPQINSSPWGPSVIAHNIGHQRERGTTNPSIPCANHSTYPVSNRSENGHAEECTTLCQGDNLEVFTIPRVAMLRSIMLNHWYH